MSMRTKPPAVAPYGTWPSPISAASLTRASRRPAFPVFVGAEVWWDEERPAEQGRTTVMVRRADGTTVELLPAPWYVRTRVHEYGGRAWLPVPAPAPGRSGAALVFAHFDDQRLYRLDPGSTDPVPLTPEPAEPGGLRYVEPVAGPDPRAGEVWCVRESHHDGAVERHVVAVPLDGSAAVDGARVRPVVGGSQFLSSPRLSPDGSRLAWLAWDHPNMPWDGTELRIGAIGPDGTVPEWMTALGGETESVFQPEWVDDRTLVAVSDRTGWWNPYRVRLGDREPEPLCPREEEFGQPQWTFGTRMHAALADGRLLTVHGRGTQRLGILDPVTGELADLDLPMSAYGSLDVRGDRAVLVGASPVRAPEVITVELGGERAGTFAVVRGEDSAASDPVPDPDPDPDWLPVPEPLVLPGPDGRDIHAYRYPPTSPDHVAPAAELPPYVVFVHGGPTSHSPAVLDLRKAYFTSRGIGVLDVDYGGSAGYGRAYRERLRGQWGIVDVEDCAAAVRALVDRGEADPARLAIRGGSAGGWTTLAALARTDVFAAGMSLCGVADARLLAATTHDFESRYLDGLLGALPDAGGVWDDRSPLTHADSVSAAVLLLQGADDPIVPLEQAERFRDAVAGRGIRHALCVYPGEQHGFRKAASIESAFEAELSFYGQVMGFDPYGVTKLDLAG